MRPEEAKIRFEMRQNRKGYTPPRMVTLSESEVELPPWWDQLPNSKERKRAMKSLRRRRMVEKFKPEPLEPIILQSAKCGVCGMPILLCGCIGIDGKPIDWGRTVSDITLNGLSLRQSAVEPNPPNDHCAES